MICKVRSLLGLNCYTLVFVNHLSPLFKYFFDVWVRILIVDDDPDITFTFKKGLEAENEKNSSNKVFFKVNSYNDPAAGTI